MSLENRPVVAFLNMHRTPTEQHGPLRAAMLAGVEVILIADHIPADLPASLVTSRRQVSSTFNQGEVLQVLDEKLAGRSLAGVVTWSNAAVEMVATIGAVHGVPTASVESARICRDKARMRIALSARRPDLCPRFARVSSWEYAESATRDMAYPLVLKPVSGSDSKGIHRTNKVDELKQAHRALMSLVD